MTRRRAGSILAASFALVLLTVDARPDAPPPPTTRSPRLLVIVSVDGLGWPRLHADLPWFRAGFRRLLAEGRVFTSCRYAHLNAETGPGHASLGTGAPPRVHGIVNNAWFEPAPGGGLRGRYCADDAPEPHVGDAVLPGPGNLRVATMADRLVARSPRSRVVSLSGKDRAAIFLAGKDERHAAYWWDTTEGRFVTSAAYRPPAEAARVVRAWNDTSGAERLPRRYAMVWNRLPGVTPAGALTPWPALMDYQMPVAGLGWPHRLGTGTQPLFKAVRASPVIDAAVTDLALAMLGDSALGLGRGSTPDVLALSFSGHDLASHYYGNESEEALEVLRHLDVQLGRLLSALDRVGPPGTVALALAADHGFEPIPEAAVARDSAYHGGRLVSGDRASVDLPTRLNRLVTDELCLDPARRWVWSGEGWNVSYDHRALPAVAGRPGCTPPAPRVDVPELDAAVARVVARVWKEELAGVLTVADRDHWSTDDRGARLAGNDWDRLRSGDAFLVPRPGVILHWDPGRGSTHGGVDDAELHVPLVFWGAAARPGVDDRTSAPYDLAPTLAALVDLVLPDATGTVLPLR